MKTLTSLVNKLIVRYRKIRWGCFHIIYFLLFAYGFVSPIMVEGSVNFHNLTTINHLLILIVIVLMFFKGAHRFCFRYLVIPAYGLIWIVFVFRIVFDLMGGLDWLATYNFRFHPGVDLKLIRLADFAYHILPLLFIYQLLYVFKDKIAHELQRLDRIRGIALAYMPFIIIVIWSMFVDPFDNYLLPKFPYCRLVLYASVFIINTVTSAAQQWIYTVPAKERMHEDVTEIITFFILLANTILGMRLFGSANLYESILQWAAFSVMLLIMLRWVPSLRIKATTWLLLPVYGFNIAVALFRELAFIVNEGNHQYFIAIIRDRGLVGVEAWYTVYLLAHYVFVIAIIASMLLQELPSSLGVESPVRTVLREQYVRAGRMGIIYKLWQGYGCMLMFVAFFVMNGGLGRYEGMVRGMLSMRTFLILALILCFAFPVGLYREHVLSAGKRKREMLLQQSS